MLLPEHPWFEITEVRSGLIGYKQFRLTDRQLTWRERVVSIPHATDDQVFLMLKHYCDEFRKWNEDDYRMVRELSA